MWSRSYLIGSSSLYRLWLSMSLASPQELHGFASPLLVWFRTISNSRTPWQQLHCKLLTSADSLSGSKVTCCPALVTSLSQDMHQKATPEALLSAARSSSSSWAFSPRSTSSRPFRVSTSLASFTSLVLLELKGPVKPPAASGSPAFTRAPNSGPQAL